MNKFFLLMGIIVSTSIFALAQNSDDYAKNEYYVGFSHQQVQNVNLRSPFQGFEVSYVRNFHRYFGAKADFSAAYNRNTSTFGGVTIQNKRSVYNYLGGIQIKDNESKSRFKPFAHALFGVGNTRNQAISTTTFNQNYTGFAAALGGGLDIKLNDKINFRAFQVDYNPVRANGNTNNSARFGIGVSFK